MSRARKVENVNVANGEPTIVEVVDQLPNQDIPEATEVPAVIPKKGKIHKMADAISEKCAKREQAKAEKAKAKADKKAETAETEKTGVLKKVGIGLGIAGALVLGGLATQALSSNANNQSDYELAPGDVQEQQAAIEAPDPPEKVESNTETETSSEYPTE